MRCVLLLTFGALLTGCTYHPAVGDCVMREGNVWKASGVGKLGFNISDPGTSRYHGYVLYGDTYVHADCPEDLGSPK